MKVELALLIAAAAVAGGFTLRPPSRQQGLRAVSSRVGRLQLLDSDTKITVRAPGASSAAAQPSATADSNSSSSSSSSGGGGTKVTVRVRSPSERAAAAASPAPVDESDDDLMVSTVTVKAPAKIVAPPPPPPTGPALTESEQTLLAAVQRANCSSILQSLLDGANPNVRDPKGRTPLHFVAGVGLAPAAVLLIHFGAQIDARDEDGLTPIHMAAGYANSQTLRVLVAAGADTTLTGNAQGTATEVVCTLGDYQLREWINNRNRFQKKDEKLDKLKACMDVLDDPQAVREEANWDEMLVEVMKAIGGPDDSNVL